ncbi:MAG: hypothetical protein IKC49_00430 [Clostridia bacterium]|nr:hypothetical protein [Clostridia bacterium]
MAGGFGGDDPQGYDEDSEVIEEQEEIEDEEQEEIDDGEYYGMTKAEYEAEERNLTKQLKEMMPKFGVGTPTTGSKKLPIYTPNEMKTMNGAKRHPKLKPFIKQIKDKMKQVRIELTKKIFNGLISIISTLMPVIMVALIILGAIGGVYYLFSYLFPSDDGAPPTGNSLNGVTGVDFYGIRTWYRDADLARGELAREYIAVLENSVVAISDINGYTVDIAVGEDAELTEDFNYNEFDAELFSENYATLAGYVGGVADLMYPIDNEGAEIPANLKDKLDGIKYFGLDASILTNLESLVEEYITNNYSFTIKDAEGNEITDGSVSVDISSIDLSMLDSTRTEKLFIKDYLIDGDTAKVSGIEKLNYAGFAFMAKRNVVIEDLSMNISFIDDTFGFSMKNNGVEISTRKVDEMNVNDINMYTYENSGDISVVAYSYSELEGNALYQLPNLQAPSELEGIQTINTDSGLIGEFNNPSAEMFLFVENETIWR